MKQLIVLCGLLGLLVACSSPTATPTIVPSVLPATPTIVLPAEPVGTAQPTEITQYEDIEWQLIQLNGQAVTHTPPPTITFANMMSITGVGFCNSYSGSYMGSMASILIGNIASTKKACPDQALMSLESAYFATIATVMYVTATNDTLTLFSANETILAVFTKK